MSARLPSIRSLNSTAILQETSVAVSNIQDLILSDPTSPQCEIAQDSEYDAEREKRIAFCYTSITEGGTRHCIESRIRAEFSVTQSTAKVDYDIAIQRLRDEQSDTRKELIEQLQAIRLTAIRKAMKRGQLQTVSILCKDLGAVLGECAPETIALTTPDLRIVVENQTASQ